MPGCSGTGTPVRDMLATVDDEDERRRRLAATFDQAADRYQRARPEYPDDVYDRLLHVTGLTPPARLLEVGAATGKATLPLARRGFPITALEPGAALAAVARESLAAYDVDVVESRFEDWVAGDHRVDLVYAATAWHWVDPAVRVAKAASVLRPGGWLALWEAVHVFPVGGDPLFAEIQDIYDEIGEGLPPDANRPKPGELPDDRAEIEATGRFHVVDVHQLAWEVDYDADGYLDLLDTFSGHIAMEDWQRERLYGEIRRRLAERPDGRLRRGWGGVLRIARLRDDPPGPTGDRWSTGDQQRPVEG